MEIEPAATQTGDVQSPEKMLMEVLAVREGVKASMEVPTKKIKNETEKPQRVERDEIDLRF